MTSTLVPADDLISDDSSFYGDDDTRDELALRSADPSLYLSYRARLPSVKAFSNTEAPAAQLSNPYEGLSTARKLNESVQDFLKRLPPSATTAEAVEQLGESWIWIANPYHTFKRTERDTREYRNKAASLLDDYSELEADVVSSMEGKAQSTITRKLTPHRTTLDRALKDAARTLSAKSGKWLLFPHESEVDQVWFTVAMAVSQGELGTAAKVAPRGSRQQDVRLICVYTSDFDDEADILRVLKRLKDSSLVGEKGIWYKADYLSEMSIEKDNKYGIRPSMYSSRDLLGQNRPGFKRRAQG